MLSPSFQPEGTIALVIRANRLPHYALILLSVCIYFTIFRSKSNQMFDIFSCKKIHTVPCFPIHAASFLKNLLLYLLSETPLFSFMFFHPSPQEKLSVDAGTIYSLISADTIEYRAQTDTRAVRKNVSLPSWMVRLADKRGINCSQVLQDALRTLLDNSTIARTH